MSEPASAKPRSAYEKTGGMVYFARMLDKIRLHAAGTLHADYHDNFGRGGDSFCCRFLQVDHAELRERVLQGGTDEEILEWCYDRGRRPAKFDLTLWNEFARKLGWNDKATPGLGKQKADSGLAHRSDIVTVFDYFDVDEGRKP